MKMLQIVKAQARKAFSWLQPSVRGGPQAAVPDAAAQPAPKATPPAAASAPAPTALQKSQLVELFNAGRFAELEAQAALLTQQYPDSGFAWSILSAALHMQGKEALLALQKTAALMPDAAPAHNNLGNALQSRGQLHEAVASYRRALELNPALAEAHSNLGNVLLDLGQLDAAMESFRQAIAIKPDFAIAHMNLGLVLGARGRLGEAVSSCRQAVTIQPDSGEMQCALGNALCDAGDIAQAMQAYQRALAIDPHQHGLSAAVWLAVRHYLQGDLALCQAMLAASESIQTKTDRKLGPIALYRDYLAKLLHAGPLRRDAPAAAAAPGVLFVVGESHSLATHGMLVSYRSQALRCNAQWIEGCKQWHLGNGQANLYKSKFEQVMARLPKPSTVLLVFGEIDCRPTEGMLKASAKPGARPLEEIARSTAQAYIAYVTRANAPYGHRMLVCGVPARNIATEAHLQVAARQHADLLRRFNTILQEEAFAAGLDFVDVHTLTDRGDGMADGSWHIDPYHLQPRAIAAAFERHCLAPPLPTVTL